MLPEHTRKITAGGCEDLYCVDVNMFDVEEFGAVYVLDADRPTIIESGTGRNYERVLEALDALDIDRADVEVIALTHVHLDHAGGAGYFAEACPNATVKIHDIGTSHLADPERLVEGTKRAVQEQWQYYDDPVPIPDDRIDAIGDGDVIDLGDHRLVVHAAPGHAPHQVVFEHPENDAVFVADAAGLWAPDPGVLAPTSPPPNFQFEQCLDDVDTLESLSPSTILYTHFGARTDVADALTEYREVLTAWVEDVREARAELEDDDAVIEHFVERTSLDDVWGDHKAYPEVRMNTRGVLRYLDSQAD
ncbi:MBL fold metallo-hydrolase [Halosolutus amylolyticus]|uniref:MBL fold metallo-hydrolase n=1 Tax=Halosolutus amylolyticus TaxID=2932267 RepID=A0ABD5PL13_9EURY|nr:MBL fold metallo-hydrolase [Halosolutus amylolyticus]